MGRGYQHATCLEAALKIKELAYLMAEGILAGELKHGPLALIDADMPVILLMTQDSLYAKTRSALEQVRHNAVALFLDVDAVFCDQVSARGGRPLVIANDNDNTIDDERYSVIRVPQTIDCLQGILTIVPLQLLSYHLAVAKGCSAFSVFVSTSPVPSDVVNLLCRCRLPKELSVSSPTTHRLLPLTPFSSTVAKSYVRWPNSHVPANSFFRTALPSNSPLLTSPLETQTLVYVRSGMQSEGAKRKAVGGKRLLQAQLLPSWIDPPSGSSFSQCFCASNLLPSSVGSASRWSWSNCE